MLNALASNFFSIVAPASSSALGEGGNLIQHDRLEGGSPFSALLGGGKAVSNTPASDLIDQKALFKASYQSYLGAQPNPLSLLQSATVQGGDVALENMTEKQKQDLLAIIQHIAGKVLKANNNGEVEIAASTEEQLESIVSNELAVDDLSQLFSDAVLLYDLRQAVRTIYSESDELLKELGAVIGDDEGPKVFSKSGEIETDVEAAVQEDDKADKEDPIISFIKALIVSKGSQDSAATPTQSIEGALLQANIAFFNNSKSALSQKEFTQQLIQNRRDALKDLNNEILSGGNSGSKSSAGIGNPAKSINGVNLSNIRSQISQNFNLNNGLFGDSRFDGEASQLGRSAENTQNGLNVAQHSAAGNKAISQAQNAGRGHTPHPITQQVMVSLQRHASTGKNEFRIQLQPSSLGHVDVRLSIERDGATRAVILAEKPETVHILQRDAYQLQKALENAGLSANVGDMEFGLKGDEKMFENALKDSGRGSKGRSKGQSHASELVEEFDNLERQIFGHYNVNYKA